MAKDNKPPHSNDIMMAQEVVRFDPSAFDMVLRSHGVLMEHFRAVKCPIGIEDRFDVRNHGDHDCSSGFIYLHAGDVTVFFSGNSSNSHLEELGLIDGSTTQITLPRNYDNGDVEIAVQHYDRFYLKEVAATSVNTQLVEAHITGKDRLQYQATSVEHIIDANGVKYSPSDYTIENGVLVWTGNHRPQYNPTISRGTVYSIRYRYTPFWYVKNIIHEVRVCRTYDHEQSREVVVRMPHAVLLQREFMFENEERKIKGESDQRDVKAPRSGSFGPR
jgi:hypothetical protein